jgi:hypothetical protein
VKGTRKVKRSKDGMGKGKATEDGRWNGKGKWKGIGNAKGIVIFSPGGDDINCAIAWQLEKDRSEADFRHGGLTRAGVLRARTIARWSNFFR